MLILLDPAHGHNTPGKRSPDGTLLEYAYTRDLANQILATLQSKGKTIRTDYARDGDPDGEENFYILRHTHCPAVLIENFFMDNKKDLAYLLSQEGRRDILETIIDGIEMCVLTLVYLSFK
ncbi:MAG: N-acetylmuramoyl-L-alanine amidase [Bacteroidales bacterium]|nr:N-acetylmuramoyl-L-alanine amidase [Bacteroidales bacterium]